MNNPYAMMLLLSPALLLLILENISAVLFLEYFYKYWPKKLVLEEELDPALFSRLNRRHPTTGRLDCEDFHGYYKISENGDRIYLRESTNPATFWRFPTIHAFGTAIIEHSGNTRKLLLFKRNFIIPAPVAALFLFLLITQFIAIKGAGVFIIMCVIGLFISFPKREQDENKLKTIYEVFKSEKNWNSTEGNR
jgi:hypothetical protein